MNKFYHLISQFIKELVVKSSPRWLVLFIDIFLVLNALVLSYIIRFNFSFSFGSHDLIMQMPLIVLLALVSFLFTGSYKGVVRHTGYKDLLSVVLSATIMTILLLIVVFLVRKTGYFKVFNMPLSVIGINYFVSIFLLVISRIAYKGFYYLITNNIKKTKRVLIHGVNSGISVYEAIQSDENYKYEVMGFVDDRSHFQNKFIHRIKVFKPQKITGKLIEAKQIEEVIISKPEATPLELLEIANIYLQHHIKVKTVPYINDWINGNIEAEQIKELNIEGLLNRSPIEMNNPKLANKISKSVVMVTGAAGSIGSEISLQVLQHHPKNIILIDMAESALYDLQQDFIRRNFKGNFVAIVGDIRDTEKIDAYLNKYKPDMIFHAAAYKHVPLMEDNPYEAIKVNVLGTKTLMDLAVKHQVGKFVMISTDKAVNPTNVMGATKRAAEIYATGLQKSSIYTKFIITRFGNVLGSNGSVIQLFKKQIKQGGPLTVTHKEINRFFMTIPEACQLVLEAGIMGKGGEIFVFDMGEPVKIYDLAVKMIQLSGLRFPDDIDIKITGLRPGEKLYEEVLGQQESNMPTYHKKVKIAQVAEVEMNKIRESFNLLIDIQELSNDELVAILKNLIPEYISNNSIFEKLDN